MKSFILSITQNIVQVSEKRKSITISSDSVQSNYPVYLKVYNTTGTDSSNSVYLNGNVRSDWGDVIIKKSDEISIPFGIVETYPTYIMLVFSANLINGDTIFYLDYNTPLDSSKITKFGISSDHHYDPLETRVDRFRALIRLGYFKDRMIAYNPDVILEGGDKIGYVTKDPELRLGLMQDVTNVHTEMATILGCPHYFWGWGNHDFEDITFASVQGEYGDKPGMVSGSLYATWSDDNFTYISLDSNYKPSTNTHMSDEHTGYGYINSDQLSWLSGALSDATKPVILFCHHLLLEADTDKFITTLPRAIYHVTNRTAVRDVLEASGKVLCVIQGHVHASFSNIIKGIPYIAVCDINGLDTDTHSWNFPNSTDGTLNGDWTKLEIDRSSKKIKVIRETQLDSTIYKLYEYHLPYKTSFDDKFGDTPEGVFAFGNVATYEKSSIITDSTDLYINDPDFIAIKAGCYYDNDPIISTRTIKIMGFTDAPDYGRANWYFAQQTGTFKVKFSVIMLSVNEKRFKLFKNNSSTEIGPYFGFNASGKIVRYKSGGEDELISYAKDIVYDFDITVKVLTEKMDIKVNGSEILTDGDFYSSGVNTLLNLEIVSQSGNMLLDRFRIEKYVTPEPQVL